MYRKVLLMLIIIPLISNGVLASEGISISLGTEYLPLSKVEFGSSDRNSYEIYDNMSVESGLYYSFDEGFRTGAIVSFFSKNISPGNSSSDISSWGVGFLGDYEYEITESGGTRLVFGMDTGFSRFKDSNSFSKRTDDSYWAAFFGGIRYFFSSRYFFEFDYRMKWQEFNLVGEPVEKTFEFSGSTLRLALGYGFFADKKTTEN